MCSIRQRFKSTPQQKLGKFFFSLSPCVYELPGYFFSFYDFIFFCSSVWVTCVRFLYFIFFFSGNFVFISFFFASLAITLALSRRVYACWNLSLAHRKSFCFALFVSVCGCAQRKKEYFFLAVCCFDWIFMDCLLAKFLGTFIIKNKNCLCKNDEERREFKAKELSHDDDGCRLA